MEACSFGNKTPSQQFRRLLRPLQPFYRYYDLVSARSSGSYQLVHYSRCLDWSPCFWNILLDRIRKNNANIGLEDWWNSNRLASYLPPPNPQLFVWSANSPLPNLPKQNSPTELNGYLSRFVYLPSHQRPHPSSISYYTPPPHTKLHPFIITNDQSSFLADDFPVNTQRYGRTGFAAWIDKRLKKRHNTSTPI